MSILTTLRQPSLIQQITFTGITADQLLTFVRNGKTHSWLNIADVDWERIIVDLDVTAFTGTTVTFKMKTCSSPSGTAVAATTMDAKNGAGTGIDSGAITTTGRSLFAVARLDTDNGPSNIGPYIGIYADVGAAQTVLAGTLNIYVGK